MVESFDVVLPAWVGPAVTLWPAEVTAAERRMELVLDLARRNVLEKTGGPFAAAVFTCDTGRVVAAGVNRVVACNCSSAHAEVVALSLAQRRLGVYDLGGEGLPRHELVVNWRPCAMCFGALLWSGIRQLTIAGSGPELETLTGFDEGPIHPEWRRELASRGIGLSEDVCRREAVELFRWFAESGSEVYNPRREPQPSPPSRSMP